jgi:cyclopropane-fatty-acyl-phospholipid synthase
LEPDVMNPELSKTDPTTSTRTPTDATAPHGAASESGTPRSAAEVMAPLLGGLFGDRVPVRFEFWDHSALGPTDGPGTVRVLSPNAISRMLWAPGELGIARAFVTGELQIDGDLCRVLRQLHRVVGRDLKVGLRLPLQAVRAAQRFGVLGRPLPHPAVEASPHGRRHSKERDAQAISHHYDISNDFYRFVLGPSMTYSCARFEDESTGLEAAQDSKHDLVCRKLGLHERQGAHLLDVGCGWGSMALHAARHYDATVVGVTLSAPQAELAGQRVKEAGLDGQIEIRLQDYRDLRGERFDAVSSIGMFEHVGAERMGAYFGTLHALLTDGGRLLNHAISNVGGSRMARDSFIGRYVFPDGELIDVGQVVLGMERVGFEVRDLESLREHYARTLRAWVKNLETNWDAAVAEVGSQRARIWHLYMAASANSFDDGGISVHQVLGVKTGTNGESRMPPTRRTWS